MSVWRRAQERSAWQMSQNEIPDEVSPEGFLDAGSIRVKVSELWQIQTKGTAEKRHRRKTAPQKNGTAEKRHRRKTAPQKNGTLSDSHLIQSYHSMRKRRLGSSGRSVPSGRRLSSSSGTVGSVGERARLRH